ncbi:MAG: FeoA family protein, partial [Candidatus Hinthialibacter sp.]
APVVASRIMAIPLSAEKIEEICNDTLSSLQIGETGKVVRFSPNCRGIERRRLMDLGIIPGTLIRADLNSPFGDPKAYFVRETSIALRNKLAEQIYVEKVKGAA